MGSSQFRTPIGQGESMAEQVVQGAMDRFEMVRDASYMCERMVWNDAGERSCRFMFCDGSFIATRHGAEDVLSVNPRIFSQLHAYAAWIVSNSHTGCFESDDECDDAITALLDAEPVTKQLALTH